MVYRNPAEYAPFEETFNPIIHRINQAIRSRAVRPNGEIEPVAPVLVKYAAPPQDLVDGAKGQTETLIKIAEVKKGN
jgi:ATP-dependent DNA helicase 2 subunit 2